MEHVQAAATVTVLAVALSALGFGLKVSNLRPGRRRALKVVHDEKGSNGAVDIVCVHGVGGHPDKTWTSSDRTNWLTDILPSDLRECDVSFRVMTYDYHKESKLSTYFPAFLHQHSRRLVKQLADKRGAEDHNRPLIFIAHSLGGLIVKGALVQSSASDVEASSLSKSIQLSTIGVLFFGTPNRDGPKLQWSKLLTRVMLISGSEPPSPDVDPLLWQDELFRLELDRYKSIEAKFRNFAFHETKHTSIEGEKKSVLAVPRDLTLPVHTSDCWESHPLKRNHEDLCKFGSRSDTEYEAVSQAMRTCLGDMSQTSDQKAKSVELRRDEQSAMSQADTGGTGVVEDEDEMSSQMIWRTQSFLPRSVLSNYPVAQSKVIQLEDELKHSSFSAKCFNPAALQTGLELIVLYHDSEEPEKSEKLYNQLKKMTKCKLDELEVNHGYRHRKTLRLAADLARLHAVAGHHQKSETLNRGLLVVTEDIFGHNSLQRAFILNQLAQNAHARDDLDQAMNLLERVYTIQTGRYKEGPKHPEAMRTSARMAIVYDQQGKYDKAQRTYREVIEFRKEAPNMGPNHPETLKAMENLALSYRLQGRATFGRAANLYREVRDYRRKVLHRFGPSDVVNPILKAEADNALHLYNETMTRLIEVVRQQNDLEELRKLEDEWSHVKQLNTAESPTSIDRADTEDDDKESRPDDHITGGDRKRGDFRLPHHKYAQSDGDEEIRSFSNMAQDHSSTRMAQPSASAGTGTGTSNSVSSNGGATQPIEAMNPSIPNRRTSTSTARHHSRNTNINIDNGIHDNPVREQFQGIGDWTQTSLTSSPPSITTTRIATEGSTELTLTLDDSSSYSSFSSSTRDGGVSPFPSSSFSLSHVRQVHFRL